MFVSLLLVMSREAGWSLIVAAKWGNGRASVLPFILNHMAVLYSNVQLCPASSWGEWRGLEHTGRQRVEEAEEEEFGGSSST